jgi:opacity protein-like surface antigen
MRNILFVAFLLAVFAGATAAQVPTSGNVFFGYSYYNTQLPSFNSSNLNGWEATLEGRVVPHFSIVADFSSHYGSQNVVPFPCPGPLPCLQPPYTSVNAAVYNVLFGPRVYASFGRFRPFAEAMFGVGHVNANLAGSDTNFTTALGGGLDYRIIRPVAWRFQGDYVQTRFFGATQNNARVSTGIVLRF